MILLNNDCLHTQNLHTVYKKSVNMNVVIFYVQFKYTAPE